MRHAEGSVERVGGVVHLRCHQRQIVRAIVLRPKRRCTCQISRQTLTAVGGRNLKRVDHRAFGSDGDKDSARWLIVQTPQQGCFGVAPRVP